MELKIKDRDYVADGAGGLVRVSGWDELLERVLFKLSVRRGSFALAPELGSNVFSLIENNAKLYHKAGNKTFQGGEWERFQEKTFLICLF